MRSRSVGGLILFVLLVAVALASLRYAWHWLYLILFNILAVVLIAGSIRARFATDPGARAWWFGFSLFGWVHLVFNAYGGEPFFPTHYLAKSACMALLSQIQRSNGHHIMISVLHDQPSIYEILDTVLLWFTVLVAWSGGILCGFIYRLQERRRGAGPAHTFLLMEKTLRKRAESPKTAWISSVSARRRSG